MCGEKVVMINGCFDILYAGYVFYFNYVVEFGDCLIVVVNIDELVKCLKGFGCLVNSIDCCMVVLVGFGVVDWVVLFSEDIL